MMLNHEGISRSDYNIFSSAALKLVSDVVDHSGSEIGNSNVVSSDISSLHLPLGRY
jgi:hypothetical protein